jgi:hypothetical protein
MVWVSFSMALDDDEELVLTCWLSQIMATLTFENE